MKNLIAAILFALILSSCSKLNISSKANRELFAVHIHGDWCKTCNKIDTVIHSLEPFFKENPKVSYVVFDETNEQTVKESAAHAAKLGLTDLFEHERHTGELLFVDKKSKKILTKFYGIEDSETYKDAVSKLLIGNNVQSILKAPKEYFLSKPPLEEIKKAKLYVIDIHHDMCGSCEVTAPIFEDVARRYLKNNQISFFTFDLSTPRTVDDTRKLAEALGINKIYESQKHTGEVLFVNAMKKEIIDRLVMEENKRTYYKKIRSLLKEI